MAIVEVVDDVAMTGHTVATHRRRGLVVGAVGMAHRAIPDHGRGRSMAVQASVSGVRDAVAIGVPIRHGRAWRDGLAVQQVVAVRDTAVVTIAAIGLSQFAVQDVKHPDVLVDRWGGNRSPLDTNKNQRHADDYGEKNEPSVHSSPHLAGLSVRGARPTGQEQNGRGMRPGHIPPSERTQLRRRFPLPARDRTPGRPEHRIDGDILRDRAKVRDDFRVRPGNDLSFHSPGRRSPAAARDDGRGDGS